MKALPMNKSRSLSWEYFCFPESVFVIKASLIPFPLSLPHVMLSTFQYDMMQPEGSH